MLRCFVVSPLLLLRFSIFFDAAVFTTPCCRRLSQPLRYAAALIIIRVYADTPLITDTMMRLLCLRRFFRRCC